MGTSTKGLAANTVLVITKAGAAYNPSASSAQGNAASWATVQAYFAANKVVQFGKLQAHLKAQHNHANYVGYNIRRGKLAPKG